MKKIKNKQRSVAKKYVKLVINHLKIERTTKNKTFKPYNSCFALCVGMNLPLPFMLLNDVTQQK